MKNNFFITLYTLLGMQLLYSQNTSGNTEQRQGIYALVDAYAQAREKKDALLLENILAADVDQLVSSGVWRTDKTESMKGMLQSSANNPGERTLTVEKIRFLNSESAIVDARYQILNTDGTVRNMWSTFVVVFEENRWKITAIRNMLPAQQH